MEPGCVFDRWCGFQVIDRTVAWILSRISPTIRGGHRFVSYCTTAVVCSPRLLTCCCRQPEKLYSCAAVYCKNKKRQLWDRGSRRNSSLQAAWDTSIARTTGFMWLIKDVSPHWGEQNLTAVERIECANTWLWICMRPCFLLVGQYVTNSSLRRRNKWSFTTRWIGQTITRNRIQTMSGGWREW